MTPSRIPQIVWFVGVAFLVALPFAVGVSRTRDFEATVELYIARGGGTAKDREAHVRGLLTLPDVQNNVVRESGFLFDPASLPRDADIQSKRRKVLLTVTAESPARARDLANALGALVSHATANRIAVHRRATAPEPSRSVDRAFGGLPGPLPATPHPVLSAATGFVIALLLYYVAVRYERRPASARDGAARSAADGAE